MNTIFHTLRSLTDLLMVTRPVILIPVWGFCALGYTTALKYAGANPSSDAPFTLLQSYLSILLFSVSVAAVYIMNQIADIEADKKNGGMPLIASGIVPIKLSILLLIVCSVISIAIPLIGNIPFLSLAALATLATGYLYSFKPFRFSGKPILDFLSNAWGYGCIAFSVGWILAGKTPISVTFIQFSLPYFFLMAGGSISSTLPDFQGDREDNKNTTAVVFGKKTSHTLALLFLLAAGIAAFCNHDVVAFLCSVAPIPFYIGYYIFSNTFFMEATYKIGGGICMINAFIALPFFIPLAVIVFIVTWLYFRIRHGINYPSLEPAKNPKIDS